MKANEWVLLHDSLSNEPYAMTRRSMDWLLALAFTAKVRSAPIGVVKLLGC